jgi:hypothetical protein
VGADEKEGGKGGWSGYTTIKRQAITLFHYTISCSILLYRNNFF